MKKLMPFLLAVPLFVFGFSVIGSHQALAASLADDTELEQVKSNIKALCRRINALDEEINSGKKRQSVFATLSKELYEKVKYNLCLDKKFPFMFQKDYSNYYNCDNCGFACDDAITEWKNWCNAPFENTGKEALETLKQNYEQLLCYEKDVLRPSSADYAKDLDKVKNLRDFMKAPNCLNMATNKFSSCYSVMDALSLNETMLKLIAEQELENLFI